MGHHLDKPRLQLRLHFWQVKSTSNFLQWYSMLARLLCYFRQSITKLLFSPIMVITDDAQNRSQLLHYFVKCVAEEYLKPPEEHWSPISQHKYIMQPHLEAFLAIEVGYLCVYSNSCITLITWPLTCLGTWFSTGYTST